MNTFIVLLRAAVQKKAFGIRNSERFGLLYSEFGKIRFIEMRMHGFERNLIPCQRIRSFFFFFFFFSLSSRHSENSVF